MLTLEICCDASQQVPSGCLWSYDVYGYSLHVHWAKETIRIQVYQNGRTHQHTYTHLHTRTTTYACMHARACKHLHTRTQTHAQAHTHALTCTHTCTNTRTHLHTSVAQTSKSWKCMAPQGCPCYT